MIWYSLDSLISFFSTKLALAMVVIDSDEFCKRSKVCSADTIDVSRGFSVDEFGLLAHDIFLNLNGSRKLLPPIFLIKVIDSPDARRIQNRAFSREIAFVATTYKSTTNTNNNIYLQTTIPLLPPGPISQEYSLVEAL